MVRHTWKKPLSLLLITLCLLAAAAAHAQMPPHRPGEVLVRFKPHAPAAALTMLETGTGAHTLSTLDHQRIHHVALPPDMSVDEALALYRSNPDVALAEPNYIVTTQAMPNDPDFYLQWGLHNTNTPGADIDAVRAWPLAMDGQIVIVAVVDTGINLHHPDLAGNTLPGWDVVDDDDTPMDVCGHGTHIAGTIAALQNNHTGIAGIGRHVQLLPVRFMDAFGIGAVSDAIDAITYALDQGARIINCSWGGSGYSRILHDLMAAADALFVCAAGNSGTNNDTSPFYPAGFNLPNLISVAASDAEDNLAWFSNWGSHSVHVAAPGHNIYSLGSGRRTVWADDFNHDELSGWTTGGEHNQWGLYQPPHDPDRWWLAVNPDGHYAHNADAWARMPDFDLTGAAGSTLSFRLTGQSEAAKDRLYVEVSTDGTHWQNQPVMLNSLIRSNGISGTIPTFTVATVDLGAFDDYRSVQIRFRFVSDSENAYDGFLIERVALTAASDDNTYVSMSGTSMAAAFVSGLAAMLQSQDITLPPELMKTLIMESVDPGEAFEHLSAGGRINAYHALMLLADPDFMDTLENGGNEGGHAAESGAGGGGCFVWSLASGSLLF